MVSDNSRYEDGLLVDFGSNIREFGPGKPF